jgi:hypothetical protein
MINELASQLQSQLKEQANNQQAIAPKKYHKSNPIY